MIKNWGLDFFCLFALSRILGRLSFSSLLENIDSKFFQKDLNKTGKNKLASTREIEEDSCYKTSIQILYNSELKPPSLPDRKKIDERKSG